MSMTAAPSSDSRFDRVATDPRFQVRTALGSVRATRHWCVNYTCPRIRVALLCLLRVDMYRE